ADLESYCARVETATGVQMAFVTLNTIEGEPVEDIANDLYRRWGIGQKGKDEGLLLLLVVKDRRSRLEIGRGLEPILTDGTSGTLLREMRESLRANQYGQAMLIAGQSLGEKVASAKGVQIAAPSPRQGMPSRAPPQGIDLPWPVLLGGLLLLFWIMTRGSGRGGRGGGGGFLPGLLLGNVLGRSSYGGHSGGGFGGYDSGDSFGGFGGGDSGGGGASSDW
ncbi:MAG: TPM domain-containing protein, partial [Bryobacteraceae bacterium]